jgi:hypothetical protein
MFKLSIYKSTERDNYLDGCSLEDGQDFGQLYTEQFKTLQHALNHIETCFGTPCLIDGRLDVQVQEDDDGQPIILSESNPDGWLATYSFYLTKVTERHVDIDDILELLPNIEQL